MPKEGKVCHLYGPLGTKIKVEIIRNQIQIQQKYVYNKGIQMQS